MDLDTTLTFVRSLLSSPASYMIPSPRQAQVLPRRLNVRRRRRFKPRARSKRAIRTPGTLTLDQSATLSEIYSSHPSRFGGAVDAHELFSPACGQDDRRTLRNKGKRQGSLNHVSHERWLDSATVSQLLPLYPTPIKMFDSPYSYPSWTR